MNTVSDCNVEYSVIKTVSHEDFDQICRTCLGKDNILPIHRTQVADIPATDLIEYSVTLKVLETDLMPQNICTNCLPDLHRIYEFKRQCHANEAVFKLILRSLEDEKTQHLPCDEKRADIDTEFKLNCTTENSVLKRPVTLECKQCKKAFSTRLSLKKHQRDAKHGRFLGNRCIVCSKYYPRGQYSDHLRLHRNEQPYQCDVCKKRFSIKGNLKRHHMIHSDKRPHVCPLCGKGFNRASSLKEHEENHSLNKKSPQKDVLRCEFCGRHFKQVDAFNNHINKHKNPKYKKKASPGKSQEIRSFPCDFCSRSYKSKSVLKTHMLSHGEKCYLCSYCGKGFATNNGLQSHLKVHTGEKRYVCIICQRAFAQVGSLEVHALTHTGERPHACKLCSKKFTQLPHLKYHMKTHSGEKSHSCTLCGSSFSGKGTLTVHMRRHTGETPYNCDVCGKGFFECSSMKKHSKKHKDATKTLKTIIM